MRITPSRAKAPCNAPTAPTFPTAARIKHEADKAVKSKERDSAISNVDPTSRAAKTPIMVAKPAIVKSNTPIVAYACGATVPALLIITMLADSDSIKVDNEAATVKVFSTGNPERTANIPAKAATTPVIITRVPLALLTREVEATIKENIAMTAESEADAVANLDGSSIDKAAIAAARSVTVTVSVIKALLEPLVDFMNLVKATIAAKTASSAITAAKPLSKPSGSIIDNKAITPVKIRIAPDIVKSITPALAAFCPAKLDKVTIAAKTMSNFVTASKDLSISRGSILDIILKA